MQALVFRIAVYSSVYRLDGVLVPETPGVCERRIKFLLLSCPSQRRSSILFPDMAWEVRDAGDAPMPLFSIRYSVRIFNVREHSISPSGSFLCTTLHLMPPNESPLLVLRIASLGAGSWCLPYIPSPPGPVVYWVSAPLQFPKG